MSYRHREYYRHNYAMYYLYNKYSPAVSSLKKKRSSEDSNEKVLLLFTVNLSKSFARK